MQSKVERACHPDVRRFLAALLLMAVIAHPVAAYADLGRSCGGWATWSDGSLLTAYGVTGDMYAYSRPATGAKVNSLYVRAPGNPGGYFVEAGYTSTGSSYYPVNQNPWMFTANGYAGVVTEDDLGYMYRLPIGQRTKITISNTTGGHTWYVYNGSQLVRAWSSAAFLYGVLDVGQERTDTSVDPRASVTYMKRLAKEGSSYTWYHWWYGVGDGYDGLYSFKFNHVGDANHWVYCDDHYN